MFDEFVRQAKKLFSSKSNGGKLVYNLADKLHYYKQILLATSIVLLLGYAQFREHFLCQSSDRSDKSTLTNFCWINGTTTINRIDTSQQQNPSVGGGAGSSSRHSPLVNDSSVNLPEGSSILDQIIPHVGFHFRLNDGKYEVINHNYMRSLWALLIMMAICSYVAQRKWSNLFADELLKALLRLPGNEELPVVRKAQEANLYGQLSRLATDSDRNRLKDALGQEQMFVEVLAEGNEHNHDLDYYPNQLIYLLGTRRQFAYKLPNLELKKRILVHSFWSLLLTVMQFLLPWCFIGQQYTLYGWNFARLTLKHLQEQLLAAPHSNEVNSLDYELTSSIFPTAVQCEYKQFSFQGVERNIVHCTVPINEICGKLFAIIWWFIVVNILVEVWCFSKQLICSVNFRTLQFAFGKLYWPGARHEAKVVNNFRYRYANLWARVEAAAAELELEAAAAAAAADDEQDSPPPQKRGLVIESSRLVNNHHHHRQLVTDEAIMKRLEAEGESLRHSRRSSYSKRRWCSMLSGDIGLLLGGGNSEKRHNNKRQSMFDNMDTVQLRDSPRESKHDTNLYYLLYLLYLRLNCSRQQVEQVILKTSEALACYLERLEHSEWSASSGAGQRSLSAPMSSSTTSTTIVPSSTSSTQATTASIQSTTAAAASPSPSAAAVAATATSHHHQQQQQQQQ